MRVLSVLYFILCSVVVTNAQPQNEGEKPLQRVQILQADYLRTLQVGDRTIDRLIGDVIIEHNNVIMSCDSAYRFPSDRFEAYGNVYVINKGTTITGDHMIYDGAQSIARVRGDIVYLQDSTATLRTNAVDYNTKDEIGFFENEGTIRDPNSLLESKQGYYYSKLKEFIFVGQVQAKTENYTLQSDSMRYNTDTKIFTFYSSTHIWPKNESYLFCNNGWYNSENETMFFLKNSYLQTDKQEVWADSMYYESETKQGKLYRNIQLLDTAQRSIAFADFSDFNTGTEEFELTIDPSMLFYPAEDDEARDTVFLRADKLRSIISPMPDSIDANIPTNKFLLSPDISIMVDSSHNTTSDSTNNNQNILPDSAESEIEFNDSIKLEIITPDSITIQKDSVYRQVFGLKNVKIFRNDFQAVCDSLYTNTIDSIWRMYHIPIIWNGEKMQLTADSVRFIPVNGQLDRGEFETNAMIVIPESDSSDFYNQIKGKDMISYFVDNELSFFKVLSQVQTIFFSSEEHAVDFKESGNMTALFKDKKIRRITYIGEVSGELSPLSLVDKERHTLKGFAWHGEQRPKSKEEILSRIIVPSKRREVEAITPPLFPITERIDKISERIPPRTERSE